MSVPPYAPQYKIAALIGYTPSKANDPFLIEPGMTWTAPESGKLYARMNDGEGLGDEIKNYEGYIEVGVTDVTPAAELPPKSLLQQFQENQLVQWIVYIFGGIVGVVALTNALPKRSMKSDNQKDVD